MRLLTQSRAARPRICAFSLSLYLRQVRDWALLAAPAATVYAPLSILSETHRRQGSGGGPSPASESTHIAVVVEAVAFPECDSAAQSGGGSWQLNRSSGLPNNEGGSSLKRRGSVEFVPWSVVSGDELLLQRVHWAKLKGEKRALEKVHRFCRMAVLLIVSFQLVLMALSHPSSGRNRFVTRCCWGPQVLQYGGGQAAGRVSAGCWQSGGVIGGPLGRS